MYAIELVSLIIFSEVENLRRIVAGLVFGENVAFLVYAVGIMDDTADLVTFGHNSDIGTDILCCSEPEKSQRIVNIQASRAYLDDSAEL